MKIIFPKYFCILIISSKKLAEILNEDSFPSVLKQQKYRLQLKVKWPRIKLTGDERLETFIKSFILKIF